MTGADLKQWDGNLRSKHRNIPLSTRIFTNSPNTTMSLSPTQNGKEPIKKQKLNNKEKPKTINKTESEQNRQKSRIRSDLIKLNPVKIHHQKMRQTSEKMSLKNATLQGSADRKLTKGNATANATHQGSADRKLTKGNVTANATHHGSAARKLTKDIVTANATHHGSANRKLTKGNVTANATHQGSADRKLKKSYVTATGTYFLSTKNSLHPGHKGQAGVSNDLHAAALEVHNLDSKPAEDLDPKEDWKMYHLIPVS